MYEEKLSKVAARPVTLTTARFGRAVLPMTEGEFYKTAARAKIVELV